ncbi:MAG: glucosyl-3-phosphoglycerate synthase [Acidimicrobiales bacterium]
MAAFLDDLDSSGLPIRSYLHHDFAVEALLRAKAEAHQQIAVCIPARDEERTIGSIVRCIKDNLVDGPHLVDELVVVDDCSTDATAAEARSAGATVVSGPGLGKGEAMRLARGRGADIVVYLDGDVENFGAHYVTGLLGPMLNDDTIMLVKGAYARAFRDSDSGGGRVTELVAKPLIALLFPELTGLAQPLAGESAVRAAVLDKVELDGGYGVEMGMVVDVSSLWGGSAIAQVDLGMRRHRNRSLSELGPQARDVIAAALARSNFVLPDL